MLLEQKYLSCLHQDDYFDAYLGVPGRFFNPYNALGRIWRAKQTNSPTPKYNKAEWGAIQAAESGVNKVSRKIASKVGWIC